MNALNISNNNNNNNNNKIQQHGILKIIKIKDCRQKIHEVKLLKHEYRQKIHKDTKN